MENKTYKISDIRNKLSEENYNTFIENIIKETTKYIETKSKIDDNNLELTIEEIENSVKEDKDTKQQVIEIIESLEFIVEEQLGNVRVSTNHPFIKVVEIENLFDLKHGAKRSEKKLEKEIEEVDDILKGFEKE